jgi:hypothetical protein
MNDTPKRPGRPPKAGTRLTPAERQRAYRERLVQKQDAAMLKPKDASTAALLASIKHFCSQIDTKPDHADIARRLVAPVISELCDRHKITLT